MLTRSFTTTPNGAMWTDARACGIPAIAGHSGAVAAADAVQGDAAMRRNRQVAPVSGGFYGTRVSNGATKSRPEGLGGRAG